MVTNPFVTIRLGALVLTFLTYKHTLVIPIYLVKLPQLWLRSLIIRMRLLVFIFLLFTGDMGLVGCQFNQTHTLTLSRQESVMAELPIIINDNDIDKNFLDPFGSEINDDEMEQRLNAEREGKQVRLIGRYTQVDVSYIKRLPPSYVGHVAVELDDGTGILLYPAWHPSAIRPANEITQFQDKRVVVIGKLVPTAPEPPDNSASLIGPCMLTIDSIELAT